MSMAIAQTYWMHLPSPIGPLLLASDGEAITHLFMSDVTPKAGWKADRGPFRKAIEELDAYFEHELKTFTVAVALSGTPFQLAAWEALKSIPYGETRSYGQQAKLIGRPSASRAVGAANGKNRVSIIVPCHRVIGSTGSLTGFGGGLDRKKWLLEHESR